MDLALHMLGLLRLLRQRLPLPPLLLLRVLQLLLQLAHTRLRARLSLWAAPAFSGAAAAAATAATTEIAASVCAIIIGVHAQSPLELSLHTLLLLSHALARALMARVGVLLLLLVLLVLLMGLAALAVVPKPGYLRQQHLDLLVLLQHLLAQLALRHAVLLQLQLQQLLLGRLPAATTTTTTSCRYLVALLLLLLLLLADAAADAAALDAEQDAPLERVELRPQLAAARVGGPAGEGELGDLGPLLV